MRQSFATTIFIFNLTDRCIYYKHYNIFFILYTRSDLKAAKLQLGAHSPLVSQSQFRITRDVIRARKLDPLVRGLADRWR